VGGHGIENSAVCSALSTWHSYQVDGLLAGEGLRPEGGGAAAARGGRVGRGSEEEDGQRKETKTKTAF
jgi:hypothetical protein